LLDDGAVAGGDHVADGVADGFEDGSRWPLMIEGVKACGEFGAVVGESGCTSAGGTAGTRRTRPCTGAPRTPAAGDRDAPLADVGVSRSSSPTDQIGPLLELADRIRSDSYDGRIQSWYHRKRIERWYPMPSLVDHHDGPDHPSLITHRRKTGRVATSPSATTRHRSSSTGTHRPRGETAPAGAHAAVAISSDRSRRPAPRGGR
jgi:hypothetical protein